MPFSIRHYRRFPLCCPVTYHAGLSEGHGTVWNVSLNGWRLSGDLRVRIGQSFPMTITLPDQEEVMTMGSKLSHRYGHCRIHHRNDVESGAGIRRKIIMACSRWHENMSARPGIEVR